MCDSLCESASRGGGGVRACEFSLKRSDTEPSDEATCPWCPVPSRCPVVVRHPDRSRVGLLRTRHFRALLRCPLRAAAARAHARAQSRRPPSDRSLPAASPRPQQSKPAPQNAVVGAAPARSAARAAGTQRLACSDYVPRSSLQQSLVCAELALAARGAKPWAAASTLYPMALHFSNRRPVGRHIAVSRAAAPRRRRYCPQ